MPATRDEPGFEGRVRRLAPDRSRPAATKTTMRFSRAFARTAATSVAALTLLALAPPARAGDPIPPILPTGSPSPSASPSSSPRPSSTPSAKPAPKPSARPQARPAPNGPAPDRYDGPTSAAVAYWLNLPKTPARTTQPLLDLLAAGLPPGMSLDRTTIVRGVWRFPIAGYTWYQDDWAAPRYEPYFHMHEGTDLFAQDGTPVVAAAGGVISKLMNGSIGGVSIWLTADDGTVYYYGHLRSYAPGLTQGARVTIGQVIATVGDTGIAAGTYPHVHFEVHPGGGKAVNPKPFLDRWLFEAEARAQDALRRAAALTASARIGAARWGSLFDLLAAPAAPAASSWAAFAGSPVAAADHALARIAYSIDWNAAPAASAQPSLPPVTPALVDGSVIAGPHGPRTFDRI